MNELPPYTYILYLIYFSLSNTLCNVFFSKKTTLLGDQSKTISFI